MSLYCMVFLRTPQMCVWENISLYWIVQGSPFLYAQKGLVSIYKYVLARRICETSTYNTDQTAKLILSMINEK